MSGSFRHWIALIASIILMALMQEQVWAQQSRKLSKQSSIESLLKDGDIIFQSSDYGQSKAVQLATHSP